MFIQFNRTHILNIRRCPHAGNRQEHKQLFLNGNPDVQNLGEPVNQLVNHPEFCPCRQIVIPLGQQTDVMPGEKPIQHQGHKLFKGIPYTFFKAMLFQHLPHFLYNFLIQRIVPIDGSIYTIQHIPSDFGFRTMQHQTLAGFADNLELIGFNFLPQLFQIAHQGGAPYIHFICQLIGQQRFLRTHQSAKHIFHTVTRGIEKIICLHHRGKLFAEPFHLEDTQTVLSLYAVNHSAVFQFLIDLPDIIPDGAFAHA